MLIQVTNRCTSRNLEAIWWISQCTPSETLSVCIANGCSGPNWIHGLKENPILDLARELGETLMDVPEVTPSIYDQAGRLLSMEEGRQCSGLMWGIIEEAYKYSDQGADSIPQNQSLLDFFKIKLKEKDIPKALADGVLELCQSWGDYVGGDVDRQSLKYLWLEETIDGGKSRPTAPNATCP